MLKRQKALLALLVLANRRVRYTAFVKLAFLLRHETPVGKDRTFYDFVPYRYGPFSFALYRELHGLARQGYVTSSEEWLSLSPHSAGLVRHIVESVPRSILDAAATVLRRYGGMGLRKLLKNVYARYPWYASRSELIDLVPRPRFTAEPAALRVYTVGYEGSSVDCFFDRILRKGIGCVLDVRANPVSRKYGFSRRSLSEIAAKLGIEYRHFPNVGVPGELRRRLPDAQSYERLLNRYQKEILPRHKADVARLAECVREKPSALLCMERDPLRCHRSRLAVAVSGKSGLPVEHL